MSLRAALPSAIILAAALFAAPSARSQSIEYRPDAKLWIIQAGDFT